MAKRDLLGSPNERPELLQWVGFAEACIMLRVPLMPSLMDPRKSLEDLRAEVIAPQWQVFKGNIGRFEAHFRDRILQVAACSGCRVARRWNGQPD